MGIRDPRGWREMAALTDSFEAEHFTYTDASARVGAATRELFVRWFPQVPAGITRTAVQALLDEPTREAMGMPAAPAAVRVAVNLAVRARGRAMALVPPRSRPFDAENSWFVRSYPDGFDLASLGPDGIPLPGATQPASRDSLSSRPG